MKCPNGEIEGKTSDTQHKVIVLEWRFARQLPSDLVVPYRLILLGIIHALLEPPSNCYQHLVLALKLSGYSLLIIEDSSGCKKEDANKSNVANYQECASHNQRQKRIAEDSQDTDQTKDGGERVFTASNTDNQSIEQVADEKSGRAENQVKD